ncbi:F0F1 ATP synthase subunit A [[Mycoplasma] testudinis]|uniref:F0F1 ATP synthase subunit A n=1 Tax=[Mycoplasma] testudinis TaxID=33924 RepID=UPI000699172A|nr:F0F1 ATP synthase subunit A [[Mycoplasma] testudinis]
MLPQAIVFQQTNEALKAANPTLAFLNTKPVDSIEWFPFEPTAVIFTIPLAVILIAIFCIVYFVKARRLSPSQAPSGYVLMVEQYVLGMESLTLDLLGERNRKVTPYFLLLMTYLGFSNVFSLFGNMPPPTSSLTVTFTLGLMTFFGTIITGFKYQRLSYLKEFTFNVKIKGHKVPVMINPLNIIEEISPLLSISVRLWGNIFAGTLIMALFYALFQLIFASVNPVPLGLALGSIFGGVVASAFHSYFDVGIALLQAYVFMLLTYSYWSNKMNAEEGQAHHKKGKRRAKKVAVEINSPGVSMNVKTTNLSDHDRI